MTLASVVFPVTQFFEPSVLYSMGTFLPSDVYQPSVNSMSSITETLQEKNPNTGGGDSGNIINEFILSRSALYIDPHGVLTFVDPDTSGSGIYTSAAFKVPMYRATHIAFVKNKTVGSFYLNGVLALQIHGMRSISYSSQYLCFGKNFETNSSFYRGYQDSIYVSNKAISLTQIGSLIGKSFVLKLYEL
jgi:hypothetical protein